MSFDARALAVDPANPSHCLYAVASGRIYAVDLYGGSGSGWDPGVNLQFQPPICRGLNVTGWSPTPAGYVLDGYGLVHGFGGVVTPPNQVWGTNPGNTGGAGLDWWRGLSMDPAGTGAGMVLRLDGAVIDCATDTTKAPVIWAADVARDLQVKWTTTGTVPKGAGYVLDLYGGIHPFGGAKGFGSPYYWKGADVARALIVTDWEAPSGYLLTSDGIVRPLGAAAWPRAELPTAADMGRGLAVPTTSPLLVITLDRDGHLRSSVRSVAPVVTFTGPTGTVSDTSRPTVGGVITPTGHDPVTAVHVRLFDHATASASGFNPVTSTAAVWAVDGPPGSVGGDLGVDLADGTWDLYGWCSTVSGDTTAAHASFTVAITRPGTPAVTAAVGETSVTLNVTGGVAGGRCSIECSDDAGATWLPLTDVPYTGTTASVVDATACFGLERTYRAASYTQTPYVASLWSATVTETLVAERRFSTLGDPAAGITLEVVVVDWSSSDHLDTGTFYPLAGGRPVVVGAAPAGQEGSMTLLADSGPDRDSLDALLVRAGRLLYRDTEGRTVWLRRTGQVERTEPFDRDGPDAYAQLAFSWVEVA